ncbi:MAG TPA: DUF6580 family putative transport protein [Patescibacteria group bacterium]|nr:DUF6580 family putative transport protein [Patescibacteria group bacterium]
MVYFFIFAGAALRLLPHEPNFTPIAAIALFSGVNLSRKQALIIPILTMLAADIFIGFASFWVTISVYGSFLIISLLGLWLKNHQKIQNMVMVSLTGSFIFFFLTNFAVWAATPWYEKNLQGIINCYYMALPFFRNTVLGDLFYVAVIFGLFELSKLLVSKRSVIWKKISLLN